MVNKIFSLAEFRFPSQACFVRLLTAIGLTLCTVVAVQAQDDSGSSTTGNAAFINKPEKMMPAPGEGVTMRDSNKIADDKTPPASQAVKEMISRSAKFVFQFTKPENGNGETIVLLHGSGGNEASLLPFARQVWPRSNLLGIRGRVLQEGRTRWYARITPVKFDQNDVRTEADAFVRFLTKLADDGELDLSHTTFVGYSNGANLLGAMMMLHPDLVKKAVLMRSMPVLDQAPAANLTKTKILVVTGADDKMYAPFAPALSGLLRSCGAKVDARVVKAGHMIGEQDVSLVTAWLSGQGPDGVPAMSQVGAVPHPALQKELPDAHEPSTSAGQLLEQVRRGHE